MSKSTTQRPHDVYFIKGEDPILISSALGATLKQIIQNDALVENFSIAENELNLALEACQTPPFFDLIRYVVIKEIGLLGSKDISDLLSYLKNPSPSTCLILVSGSGSITPLLLRALKEQNVYIIEAGVPSKRNRRPWFLKKIKESQLRIETAAVEKLEEHLGDDIARLEGILSNLKARYGEKALLSFSEIDPFLGLAGGVGPWELTDAIDKGNPALALEILQRLLNSQKHPLVILTILYRHYLSMLSLEGKGVLTEDEAAKIIGSKSTFTAKKTMLQARKLSKDKIHDAIILLADADADLRGEKGWENQLTLEVLVGRLSAMSR